MRVSRRYWPSMGCAESQQQLYDRESLSFSWLHHDLAHVSASQSEERRRVVRACQIISTSRWPDNLRELFEFRNR
jgi:hypothetical protein